MDERTRGVFFEKGESSTTSGVENPGMSSLPFFFCWVVFSFYFLFSPLSIALIQRIKASKLLALLWGGGVVFVVAKNVMWGQTIRDDLRGLDKLGNRFVVFLGYRV